jgi:hypothetical protein
MLQPAGPDAPADVVLLALQHMAAQMDAAAATSQHLLLACEDVVPLSMTEGDL